MKFIMGQAETPLLKQNEQPQGSTTIELIHCLDVPKSPIEEISSSNSSEQTSFNSTFNMIRKATLAVFVAYLLYASPGTTFFMQFLYWLSAWLFFELSFLAVPKFLPNSSPATPVQVCLLK